MISCHPSLITLSLYLPPVCSLNLFLSLLIQLSLYALKSSPVHSPHPACFSLPLSVLILDMTRGQGSHEDLQKLTKLDYIQHMCFTMLPLRFPWSFQDSTVSDCVEIYCWSLRGKWMQHLCHFNGSLIMWGWIALTPIYQKKREKNRTVWGVVGRRGWLLAGTPFGMDYATQWMLDLSLNRSL